MYNDLGSTVSARFIGFCLSILKIIYFFKNSFNHVFQLARLM